jgi:hypothetical protein
MGTGWNERRSTTFGRGLESGGPQLDDESSPTAAGDEMESGGSGVVGKFMVGGSFFTRRLRVRPSSKTPSVVFVPYPLYLFSCLLPADGLTEHRATAALDPLS